MGATIKKRREELQEVTHTNAVEMDSIKTKAAEAISKAKEEHEKKVCRTKMCDQRRVEECPVHFLGISAQNKENASEGGGRSDTNTHKQWLCAGRSFRTFCEPWGCFCTMRIRLPL